MTTLPAGTPPKFTSIDDGHGTRTLYRHVDRGDATVVAVRRDTPADPQHLAAPPALDPDVYDLLANAADPGEQVVERVARCLLPDGHDGPHETPRSIIAADRDRLARENDDLRKQLHDAEVQAAQRSDAEFFVAGAGEPEQVDPADVQVGDVVEIDWHSDDEPDWTLTGTVTATEFDGRLLRVAGKPWDILPAYCTVRRLRRAEPQPDPEQVKALAAIVRDLNREAINLTPNEVAERLVRRGVVVRDEH